MSIPADSWFREEFLACPKGAEYDYVGRNQPIGIELMRRPRGVTDLQAGILRMAISLEDKSTDHRACLVFRIPRITLSRLKKEWDDAQMVLRPEIGRRITLLGIGEQFLWIEPESDYFRQVGQILERDVWASDTPRRRANSVPTQKFFEVCKVLLCRWLKKQDPIPIGKLSQVVGCDYRTTSGTLERLRAEGVLARKTDRSVELKEFPDQTWNELLVLSSSIRPIIRYVDASGQQPDPTNLLKRLRRLMPEKVALGGVVAARHWCPDLDLNGTPRLDLIVHAPQGSVDLSFVMKLDPALQQVEDKMQSAVLTIRSLVRADPLFETNSQDELPLADPVETLLDLHDLGLDQQANQVLTHLRQEGFK